MKTLFFHLEVYLCFLYKADSSPPMDNFVFNVNESRHGRRSVRYLGTAYAFFKSRCTTFPWVSSATISTSAFPNTFLSPPSVSVKIVSNSPKFLNSLLWSISWSLQTGSLFKSWSVASMISETNFTLDTTLSTCDSVNFFLQACPKRFFLLQKWFQPYLSYNTHFWYDLAYHSSCKICYC